VLSLQFGRISLHFAYLQGETRSLWTASTATFFLIDRVRVAAGQCGRICRRTAPDFGSSDFGVSGRDDFASYSRAL
jgi:hypothetical protein